MFNVDVMEGLAAIFSRSSQRFDATQYCKEISGIIDFDVCQNMIDCTGDVVLIKDVKLFFKFMKLAKCICLKEIVTWSGGSIPIGIIVEHFESFHSPSSNCVVHLPGLSARGLQKVQEQLRELLNGIDQLNFTALLHHLLEVQSSTRGARGRGPIKNIKFPVDLSIACSPDFIQSLLVPRGTVHPGLDGVNILPHNQSDEFRTLYFMFQSLSAVFSLKDWGSFVVMDNNGLVIDLKCLTSPISGLGMTFCTNCSAKNAEHVMKIFVKNVMSKSQELDLPLESIQFIRGLHSFVFQSSSTVIGQFREYYDKIQQSVQYSFRDTAAPPPYADTNGSFHVCGATAATGNALTQHIEGGERGFPPSYEELTGGEHSPVLVRSHEPELVIIPAALAPRTTTLTPSNCSWSEEVRNESGATVTAASVVDEKR